MDYKEFSAKIKSKYPQYRDLDDRELAEKVIAKYPEYKNQVTIENLSPNIKKGIDITPSNLYKKAISYPAAGLRSIARGEDFHTALGKTRAAYEDFKPLHGTADFLFDTGVYSKLPMLKGVGKAGKAKAFIGNALIQGGVPGAIEGLKEDNAIGGGVTGTGIAAGLQGGINLLPRIGKAVAPIFRNEKFQNAVAKGIEGLTSVPEKYSKLALQSELAGKSILNGPFDVETAYQNIERKLRTAKGMLPTDKQYKEQYKQLGNQVREKLNKTIKSDEYFNEMFNKLGTQSGEYVQSLRKAKGEAVGNAKRGLKESLDRFDYKDLINDIEQVFKAQQKDLINPAEYDTGALKQELINLVKSGTRFNKRVVDPTKPITDFDNLYSHFLDYIEQNKTNPIVINNAQTVLRQISKNLKPELQNYYSNALKGDLDTIINYGKVTPESLEGITDWIGQQAKFRDNKYATPYAEPILQQLYGKFSNRLKNISPDLEKSNREFSDLMSKLKALGIDEEKIPANKMAEIIKNYVYGNGKQIRSGQNLVLEDLLSPELIGNIKELDNAYVAQQQLQKNIGEAILNDISKYQNAPYATQEALERVAPEQIEQFAKLLDQQTTQKDILKPISSKSYERNPRLLSNRSDLATEEALAYLQERSGINFMDELENIRAREAFEKLTPGQGGGSGSTQGIQNLVRGGVTTSAAGLGGAMGGIPGAILAPALSLSAFSPKIMGKGTIKNIGNLYRNAENWQRLVPEEITRILSPALIQGIYGD